MATFPINNTPKDKAMLRDEYLAHETNQRRDIQLSIRNRTMTKEMYYKVTRSLRTFWQHWQQNKFVADDYIF